MPKSKNKMTRSRSEQKLRAANAEIKRLRTQLKECSCTPMTPERRHAIAERLCNHLKNLPRNAYDPEKIRAAGLTWPLDLPDCGACEFINRIKKG